MDLEKQMAEATNESKLCKRKLSVIEQSCSNAKLENDVLERKEKELLDSNRKLKSTLVTFEKERDRAFDFISHMFLNTREVCHDAFKSRFPDEDFSFLEGLILQDEERDLHQCGIHFKKNNEKGIDVNGIAGFLILKGIVLNDGDGARWIMFQSGLCLYL
ncbi:probable CCR4-associated factor 1 homolog 10 [Pistacia vera]|uniref:probable CCR4-associated factor 1 homolog 10 n=1 Tax=Pistacia vera TaxID=55513 RepID=UPI001263306C|nr:probable CCR4-associated factor 1 homolog 10 [Pistacia vera]